MKKWGGLHYELNIERVLKLKHLIINKRNYKWEESLNPLLKNQNTVSNLPSFNIHITYCLIVTMKVVGGEVTPPAALAPKCGPLGIPPKKVGEDIQKATTKWKGIKIHIRAKV